MNCFLCYRVTDRRLCGTIHSWHSYLFMFCLWRWSARCCIVCRCYIVFQLLLRLLLPLGSRFLINSFIVRNWLLFLSKFGGRNENQEINRIPDWLVYHEYNLFPLNPECQKTVQIYSFRAMQVPLFFFNWLHSHISSIVSFPVFTLQICAS